MERRELTCGGRTRTWLEVPGDPETLLVVLHGSLQSANVMRNFTSRQFEELGPTVVYPDGVSRHFNDLRTGLAEETRRLGVDDVGFITKLVEHYTPERIIGAGFSNGGQMVLRMLFDAPGLLTGAALFGASMPTEDNTAVDTSNYLPTPVVSVQGTADPLVPYEGGVAGINDNNRGETRSAVGSAAYLAERNGCTGHTVQVHEGYRVDTWDGEAPVQLWSIENFGHMVPGRTDLDPRIGPGTELVTGADIIRGFFSLGRGAGGRTR